ncbi:radical SAM protein [Spirulina subsalsa]|uniref:radical SAM protein n=1 Tax=Spirulina subsalsa TaxID=54311 RepID=UPI000367A6EF|nr:radical SAM protein [Spirulina subsalsa]
MKIADEEVFVLKHSYNQGKCIIYAPLRSYLAQVPEEIGEVISSTEDTLLKATFIERLKNQPLLKMSDILDNLHNAVPELAIAITDNCTLRCVYCHASAGEKHKQASMSKEVVDAVLTSYFNFIGSPDVISVNFHGGGEPTYALPLLQYTIEKAKKIADSRGIKVGFAMPTNGFYGDEVRQFIVENFTSVSLSFDGPAFIQNRHRPLPNGNGSFQQVFETAKYFYNRQFPFAFRATVSSFSLPHLFEIIDLIAEEFPGRSIGIESLNPFGRALQPEVLNRYL